MHPAVRVVNELLPGMLDRGAGGLLFAVGLGGQLPMPTLGIGGLVERGDIHAMVLANAERFGPVAGYTLDPDVIAAEPWGLYAERDRAEATFNAMR